MDNTVMFWLKVCVTAMFVAQVFHTFLIAEINSRLEKLEREKEAK